VAVLAGKTLQARIKIGAKAVQKPKRKLFAFIANAACFIIGYGLIKMSLAFLPQGTALASSPNFSAAELPFAALPGFAKDDHLAAFKVFLTSCRPLADERSPQRQAKAPSSALIELCRKALQQKLKTAAEARAFFETNFRPFKIIPESQAQEPSAFFTGYYEPIVEGSLTQSAVFSSPLYNLPDDLIVFPPDQAPPGLDPELRGARRLPDGSLEAYPDRAAIENGAINARVTPIVFLKDLAEAFLIHVQGSAQVRLPDGQVLRLVYAGRNGQPYTSIGRILIETGEIALEEMSLARLKDWIRTHGQRPGEAGARLMARNKSYIFFAPDTALQATQGPVGGAGVSLSALRSIAIDRSIWSYGLPIFINCEIPRTQDDGHDEKASSFQRLMIAQDTGSAILGPARADIFFGSGPEAGRRAGNIQHRGEFFVLLPKDEARGRDSFFP
jgi:membrane-bound lytic murein transglycosylase A